MNLTEIYIVQEEERIRNSPEAFLDQFKEYFDLMRGVIHHAVETHFVGFSIGSSGNVRYDSINDADEQVTAAGIMGRGIAMNSIVFDDPWPTIDEGYSNAFTPAHSLAYSTISEIERIRQLMEYQEAPTEYYGEVKDLFKRSWRRRNQDDAIDFFNAEDLRRRVRNTPLLEIHHTSQPLVGCSPGYAEEKERMMFL